MLDNFTKVNIGGDTFKFDVDAVSGLLHKSTRKSKFCVRKVSDDNMIFNDERPALKQDTWDKKQPEIVVLQTMLAGNDKMIVEYMDREDYDEMFDGPRPQVDVEQLYRTVRKEVLDKLADDEEYGRRLRHYKIERGESLTEEDVDFTYEKDRSAMAEELVKLITKSVCTHLEASHIGTFEKMDHLY